MLCHCHSAQGLLAWYAMEECENYPRAHHSSLPRWSRGLLRVWSKILPVSSQWKTFAWADCRAVLFTDYSDLMINHCGWVWCFQIVTQRFFISVFLNHFKHIIHHDCKMIFSKKHIGDLEDLKISWFRVKHSDFCHQLLYESMKD